MVSTVCSSIIFIATLRKKYYYDPVFTDQERRLIDVEKNLLADGRCDSCLYLLSPDFMY